MRVAAQAIMDFPVPTYAPVEVLPARAPDALPSHYPAGIGNTDPLPVERVHEGELLRATQQARYTPAPAVFATLLTTENPAPASNLYHPAIAAYYTNSLRPDLMTQRTGRLVDDYA
jgi:hypothetical protein